MHSDKHNSEMVKATGLISSCRFVPRCALSPNAAAPMLASWFYQSLPLLSFALHSFLHYLCTIWYLIWINIAEMHQHLHFYPALHIHTHAHTVQNTTLINRHAPTADRKIYSNIWSFEVSTFGLVLYLGGKFNPIAFTKQQVEYV